MSGGDLYSNSASTIELTRQPKHSRLPHSTPKKVITFQAEAIKERTHNIVKTACLKLSQPGSRRGTLSMICLKEHVTFAGSVVWEALVRAHKA